MDRGSHRDGATFDPEPDHSFEGVPERSLDLVREVRELRRRAADAQAQSRVLLDEISEVRRTAEQLSTMVQGGRDA